MNNTLKPGFHIRSEGRAERCEICHQADQFDPHTGVCGRCNALTVRPPTGLEVRNLNLPTQLRNFLRDELEGSEQLLWVGTPQVTDRWEKIGLVFLSVALIGFCVWLGTPSDREHTDQLFLTFFGSILSGFTGFFMFFQGRHMRKQLYAVTNKRVVLCAYRKSLRVQSLFKEQLRSLSRIQRPDGGGTICNGGIPIFRHIREVHEVEKLIRRYILQENKPH